MEIQQNLTQQFIRYTSAALRASLTDEVSATPKPGLVDLHDSGAHTDMDYRTFTASAEAIVPYLTSMAELGLRWQQTGRPLPGRTEEESLFLALRPVGIQAETSMFAATKGVNTHKGAIFSMGIVAAASGYLFADLLSRRESGAGGHLHSEAILDLCRKMCRRPLEEDFAAISPSAPKTHGERLYIQHGCRGIRGEAADGFPSVRSFALLTLRKELEARKTASGPCDPSEWNRICLTTFLSLMANVDDTNILYRTDYESLLYAKECAHKILTGHPHMDAAGMEALRKLNKDFTRRNLSPGGCADLLAITLFLWRMEQFSPGTPIR